MSDININQLYNSVIEKRIVKYKTYESILKKCHLRIKRFAENLKLNCTYDIPRFILGTPLYEFKELKKYIIDNLTNSGFTIKQLSETIIYISWDLKSKTKKINKNKKENFRNINDYNPSGRFINTNNTLAIQNINDKINLIGI
jgi:hypothetical protein